MVAVRRFRASIDVRAGAGSDCYCCISHVMQPL
jgi:hypothetical protein